MGPLLIERLGALALRDVELLTDFQLQVEFLLDLQERREVVFIDASVDAPAPFTFSPAVAVQDASYSSHQMSPGALLHAYQQLFGEPPTAFVLAIRGQCFELGEDVSSAANAHLDSALEYLMHRFFDTCP